jgi:hypothetical protein
VALSLKRMPNCALDNADIVREAISRQLRMGIPSAKADPRAGGKEDWSQEHGLLMFYQASEFPGEVGKTIVVRIIWTMFYMAAQD